MVEQQVLWHVAMSVDGFIAGPGDEMSWALGRPREEDQPASTVGAEVVGRTGAILAGRRWYDVARRRYNGRAGIYGGSWTGRVFVLSHRPPEDGHDPGVTFLSGGLTEALDTARVAADGRDVGLFGADLAGQYVAAGLVDEIIIHLVPVLLGGGVRLYDRPEGDPIALERVAVGTTGPMTDLRLRPVA